MALKLGNYYFDGPHPTASELEDVPGIVAVISNYHGRQSLAEIRETSDIRKEATAIAKANNQDPSSPPKGNNAVLFAAIYMRNQPDMERQRIIREFQDQFDLPAELADMDYSE